MTTSACATGATISYYVGGSGSLVTFQSATAGTMTNGIAQNPFGTLIASDTSPVLGPATTVNATFFALVTAQYGGTLPGVLPLN